MPLGRDLSWSNLKQAASSRLGSHGKHSSNDSDPSNSASASASADTALTSRSTHHESSADTKGGRGPHHLAVPGSDSQASFSAQTMASAQSLSSSPSSSSGAATPVKGVTAPLPLALLRLQIIRASNLSPKDRNGKADPFVCVSIPGLASLASKEASSSKGQDPHELYRRQTVVVPKTLEPEWKDAVWDFEITNDWFGPGGWQDGEDDEGAAADESGDIEAPAADNADAIAALSALSLGTDSPSQSQPTIATPDTGSAPHTRPSSRRMLSATASKVLSTSAKGMRMLPKGAAAGARAVARGAPRPMRLRRNNPRRSRGVTAGLVSNLEIVVWDKDFARREYMGEASWPVWEWCRGNRRVEWASASSKDDDGTVWLPLVSSRQSAKVSGQVQVRLGFVPVPGSPVRSMDRLYRSLVASAVNAGSRAVESAAQPHGDAAAVNDEEIRAGIRAIPASQSVGTAERFFADDGFSSDEEEEDQEELLDTSDSDDDVDDDDSSSSSDGETDTDDLLSTGEEDLSSTNVTEGESDVDVIARHRQRIRAATPESQRIMSAVGAVEGGSSGSASPAPHHTPDTSTEGAPTSRRRRLFKSLGMKRGAQEDEAASAEMGGSSRTDSPVPGALSGGGKIANKIPGRRRRRRSRKHGDDADDATKDAESQRQRKLRRMQRRLARREQAREVRDQRREAREARTDYNFNSSSDIIGIVMMEVKGAKDLPRWRNSIRTGFDMDPFTIVAFGQKIFRTRVLRHTLNPTWDEKLLFHVHQHEGNFVVKMSVYDWDKLSANDHVGSCELPMSALTEAAPKPEGKTGLYSVKDDGLHQMQTFNLPLNRAAKDEDVKYGESSPQLTVAAKFTPYAALRQRFWRQLCQQFDTDDSETLSLIELTSMLDSLGSTLTSETIASFFARYGKSAETDAITIDEAIIALENETRKANKDKRKTVAGTATPAASDHAVAREGPPVNQDSKGQPTMDPTGPQAAAPSIVVNADDGGGGSGGNDGVGPVASRAHEVSSANAPASKPIEHATSEPKDANPGQQATVERVILLKSCPLCHMPRLSKKGDGDVVTHLAVCASQDWRRVDSMVVGNFVTASQAHRKWFNKIVITATQGRYKLGVNSANIIVQDRESGELLEEKMQVYVRLGIRLLYQGARSRMEGARIRRMLKNMSVKQGKKYDAPSSAREIPGFIAFHNLNVDEIRDPLDSFKTFNEFFYRKLKVDARPVSEPKNPARLVSAADCRLMVFASIEQATTIWVKGREFTVSRLLGKAMQQALGKEEAQEYDNGSLCIFRLAPQDYHRFHCPADATVGKPHAIEGAYYTVNPMAIRSAIDIYGENVRVVVPFHSETFGTFFAVNVGAMMVGSVEITVKEGQQVKRGDEMGYYAFGGSTTILVFKRGAVTWDEDILANSHASIETLVKQGTGIGRATDSLPAEQRDVVKQQQSTKLKEVSPQME
ncbi:unnamed protein product [Parajaminaea phylloscopi]